MKLKTDDAKWMASPPAQRLNVGETLTPEEKKTDHGIHHLPATVHDYLNMTQK
jgi:hypothetical protein